MNLAAVNFGHARFVTGPSRTSRDWTAYLDHVRSMSLDYAVLDEASSVDATVLRLPHVGVVSGTTSAFRALRTRAMAEGTDSRLLFLCREGASVISHLGREETVRAGQAILLSSADPIRIERSVLRHIVLTVPRSVLAPMIAGGDTMLMSPMDGTSEPLRLLQGYVDLLSADPVMCRDTANGLIASHVLDLITLALGASREAAEAAAGRGLRAVRLRALKDDVERNLASSDVTAQALSRRHGISPRYIRKLFEGEGTSLSQFVLGRRLLRAHRMLNDPRYVNCTIGSIAFDVGFGDLSRFNHAFRRQFGMTPSEVRDGTRRRGMTGAISRSASPKAAR